ncbi:TPA: hypothetical protein ACTZGK_002560 [Raoultella planticola]
MYDDYDQREANIASFLSNKIKRCIKCGRELDYKEKFYYTDRICNPCRGLQPFDSDDVPGVESEGKSPFQLLISIYQSMRIKGSKTDLILRNRSLAVILNGNYYEKKRRKIGMQLTHGLKE